MAQRLWHRERVSHPAIDNRSGLALTTLFLSDEDGRPLFVPLLQLTLVITAADRLALAEEQPQPHIAGELFGRDSNVSSYRIEPLFAFIKPSTDIILNGHAHPGQPAEQHDVTLAVGNLQKTVRVFGDRVWVRSAGATTMTRPQPFEHMPLCYERAYGGWDRSHAEPEKHSCERRNPVGMGYRAADSAFEEIRLPNIEDPDQLITRYHDAAPPAGFGFISPHWLPRASLCGTHDEAWRQERLPLVPHDFDRRYFNAGSAGLIADGYLRGDEPLAVLGASSLGNLHLSLPAMAPPRCEVHLRRRSCERTLDLDTVIVDTDRLTLSLWYRAHVPLRDGPHDVVAATLHATLPDLARAPLPSAA